jgi:hypothetical protein
MKVFTHPPRIPPQGAGNLPIVIQSYIHIVVATPNFFLFHKSALGQRVARYLVAVMHDTPKSRCTNSIFVYGCMNRLLLRY